jgi:protein ImuA
MAATETIRALADRIRTLETSFRPCAPTTIPLGALSEVFPDGLSAGSLVELLPRAPGAGAWTLALILAHHACGERKTLLITDPERCFYPPAAQKFGMDVKRTIIVRAKKPSDALLALAQALRCSAIGAAIGAFDKLTDRDARRLQLAAEDGGTLGVLVRPASALHAPSFAAVRLLLAPLPSARGRRRVQIEVVRFRSAACGLAKRAKPQAANLEIDDATGHVRPLSALELAADSPPQARATG